MMEFLRDWILGIVVVSLLSGGAQAVAGKSGAARVVRLIGALLLLFAVLSPLRLDGAALLERAYQAWQHSFQTAEADIHAAGTALYRDAAETALADRVEELAAELGISCKAEVRLAEGEEGLFPASCRMTAISLTEEQETLLHAQVQEVLGTDQIRIERG